MKEYTASYKDVKNCYQGVAGAREGSLHELDVGAMGAWGLGVMQLCELMKYKAE